MKLIDKDKVVAEIRNRVDSYKGDGIISIGVLKQHCEDFIYYLDTLEVKEVDLDFEQELYKAFGQVKDFTLGMRIAKHFYELGLKSK